MAGIGKHKAQELLDNSKHDVTHFEPSILQEVLDAWENFRNDMLCGLFDARDKANALCFAMAKHEYGPGTNVHTLVGFQKGYGKKMLVAMRDMLGPMWLTVAPEQVGDTTKPQFGLNNELLDNFYRKIPWLAEFQLEDSIWHCPVSFFYSEGIDVEELSKFCQAEFC